MLYNQSVSCSNKSKSSYLDINVYKFNCAAQIKNLINVHDARQWWLIHIVHYSPFVSFYSHTTKKEKNVKKKKKSLDILTFFFPISFVFRTTAPSEQKA